MKKVVFACIALLMMLAQPASSDILGSRDSLRVAICDQLNMPVTGTDQVDSNVIHRVINRAIQQVCTDVPALENKGTIVTNDSTRYYALNDDFVIVRSVVIFLGDTAMIPLKREFVDSLYEKEGDDVGGAVGTPQDDGGSPRYYQVHTDEIWFYPQPIQTDTVIVEYYAVGAGLTTDTSTVEIRKTFREAVVNYACFCLLKRLSRYETAAIYHADYEKQIK